jgi:hypothetical protein
LAGATLTEATKLSLKPDSDRAKLVLALGSAQLEKGDKRPGKGQTYAVRIGAGAAYELRGSFREHLAAEI